MQALLRHYDTVRQVLALPVADLRFDAQIDPADVSTTYRNFTRPHPRYRVFRHKTLGAALIDLQRFADAAAYLDTIQGRNRGAHHARRARTRGYVCQEIDRNDHVDAIHAINTSLEMRQGRPMDTKYLDKVSHFDRLGHYSYYGILNGDRQLVAYANIGRFGNFSALSQVLGLRGNDGFMHLLMVEIVTRLIEQRRVRYVMYDTFFGAQPRPPAVQARDRVRAVSREVQSAMKKLINRLYADYFMPSRLREYEALLVEAAGAGYRQLSIRAFYRAVGKPNGDVGKVGKVLVHRHDIDSDLRTARKLFDLERKHGVGASYYFRLSTLDVGFMREIEAAGSEASYHFEEVATFAKRHRLRCAAQVRHHFPDIREEFVRNFDRISQDLGLRMSTVASHGDFANRRLNVINHELLRDDVLRRRCGIECESYDSALLRHFDLYISDRPYPVYYHPMSPFEALGRHERICFLTHPVQWETN